MEYVDQTLLSPDSIRLYVRHYPAPRSWGIPESAQRTLLIVHGLGEHSARYEHIAESFVARNWRVIVGDLRGHGLSEGTHTHVGQFDEYAADIDLIWNHFQLNPQRTVLLGHSMGGLVSARFAQTCFDRMAALVLCSPLLGVKVEIPRLLLLSARVISWVLPTKRFRSRLRPENISQNPEAIARRYADPQIRKSVTAGWFFAMRQALKMVWEQAARINIPLLMLQSGADELVDSNAAQTWFYAVSSQDKDFRLYPNHFHELLNEVDWEEIVTGVLDWLDQRLPIVPAQSHRASRRAA